MRLVHENKLRVVLNARDMEELSLRYDEMDVRDGCTREALLYLLDRAGETERFNPKGAKLFVETYPCEGGGCVLYFTCVYTDPSGKARLQPVVFEFSGEEAMIRGACQAHRRYRQRIYRSSLHLLAGRYCLTIYPLDYSDRLSVYFLSEFGSVVGVGELPAAYTAEHGKALLEEDAVEKIWTYFGEGEPEEGAEGEKEGE